MGEVDTQIRSELNRAKKIEYLQKLMAMQENKIEELNMKETSGAKSPLAEVFRQPHKKSRVHLHSKSISENVQPLTKLLKF